MSVKTATQDILAGHDPHEIRSPDILGPLKGRINDIDSHELIPAKLWPEVFGDITEPYAKAFIEHQDPSMQNAVSVDLDEEVTPLDPSTVWSVKGAWAPGAIDMSRRVQMMDLVGIKSSLIFPTGPGLVGLLLASGGDHVLELAVGFSPPFDPVLAGRDLCTAHNNWCINVSKQNERLRPVAIIETSDLGAAIAEVERVAASGVKAAMIASGVPIGGKSPAHPDVDPFYRAFTEAGIPLLLHVGGEFGFLSTDSWLNSPHFQANVTHSLELGLDPFSTSTIHFASQNFISAAVLGGVFERHPELRLGAIEVTSHWVGPMVESMTLWAEQYRRRLEGKLSLSPAEYVERNVRVSSFWWEPTDRYIDRHGVPSVYAFASDYPHFEGGTDPLNVWVERLSRFGESYLEDFFVNNGNLLLP